MRRENSQLNITTFKNGKSSYGGLIGKILNMKNVAGIVVIKQELDLRPLKRRKTL
jgi:hypothetical protein